MDARDRNIIDNSTTANASQKTTTDRSLTVIQWNCNTIKGKKAALEEIAIRSKADIIMLQETRVRNFHLKNYITYKPHGTHCQDIDKVATLVHNKIESALLPDIAVGEGNIAVSVRIKNNGEDLYLHNIYSNPKVKKLDIKQLLNHHQTSIIGGDINAIDELWASQSDKKGEDVREQLEEAGTHTVLNDGNPTRPNGRAVDVTFVSNRIAALSTWALDKYLASDHNAIKITIDRKADRIASKHVPRRRIKQAKWEEYQKALGGLIDRFETPDSLEDHANEIIKIINEAADGTIPMSKQPIERDAPWLNHQKVREAKSILNKLYKLKKNCKNEEERNAIKREITSALTYHQQKCQVAKSEYFQEFLDSIDLHTPDRQVWQALRTMASNGKKSHCASTNPKLEAERLATTFADRCNKSPATAENQQILNEEIDRVRPIVEQAILEPHEADQDITLSELENAIRRCKKDTAAGADNITYSMIKNSNSKLKKAILELMNKSYEQGTLPHCWLDTITCAIPKKEKGQYRPITLLTVIDKLMQRILHERLKYLLPSPHPNIYGFTNTRSTTDAIALVNQLISERLHKDRPSSVVPIGIFLDALRAFETCDSTIICHKLVNKGITGRLIKWIRSFMSKERQSKVRFQGEYSSPHQFERGVPQGSVLSPFLFNLLMEDIVNQSYPKGTTVLSYADDLAIVSSGQNATWQAQKAIDILFKKCTLNSITISETKSKAIAFRLGNKAPPNQHIVIEGKDLEWVDSHMYLGIIMDKRLSFRKHIRYILSRARKRINILRCITGTTWAELASLLLYYTAAIRGLIEYAAPALGPIHKKMGQDLEIIQNLAVKAILRLPQDANPIAARIDIGLDSIVQRFEQLTTSFLAKTVHRPDDNPLKQAIITKQNVDSNWHRIHSWAANATDMYRKNMKQDISETIQIANITAKIQKPWEERRIKVFELPMNTSKDKCDQNKLRDRAEKYIQETIERIDSPHIYYTDGSLNPENQRAASAFTMMADNQQHQQYSRISDGASTLQTELIAIKIALDSKCTPTERNIVIFTDSLSAIKVLDRANPEPQNIEIVNQIFEQADKFEKPIEIHWIPSHIGIEGNEEADKLANLGTTKTSIDIEFSETVKQQTRRMIGNSKNQDREEIDSLIASDRAVNWLNNINELKPWKHRPRIKASIAKQINMLRLGVTPYIYKGRREGVLCRYCEASEINPIHYLVRCPELITHRYEVINAAEITETDAIQVAAQILRYSQDNVEPLARLLKIAPYLYKPEIEVNSQETTNIGNSCSAQPPPSQS